MRFTIMGKKELIWWGLIIPALLIILLAQTTYATSSDITTKSVETSVIERLAGYTKISVKLETMNYGNPVKVYIKVKALDFSGHEVDSITLAATMQKYDSRKLTGTAMVRDAVASKINRWEVDSINAYTVRD